MVIIKCNVLLNTEDRRRLEINIHDQAADGVIVLPYCCELLTVTPDTAVQIAQQNNTDRVAELERQLAAAMEYITAQKDCDTCKYDGSQPACISDCLECASTAEDCTCKNCYNSSKWKWRYSND